MMKKLCLLLLACVLCGIAGAKHYTVIVSLDGFRWDYTEMYNTPWLDSIARSGVKAVMQPSFPSSTFPNHYTLATGLVPDHHGIIANKFRDFKSGLTFSLGDKTNKSDPRFWGGEPIWNTAMRQGVKVGIVYWPGSDVKIGGHFPTYYKDYEVKPLLTFSQRIAVVDRLLTLPEKDRPSLVMAYFDQPDHDGHSYGPHDKRVRRTVETMDMLMGQLWSDLRSLPIRDSINLIVTADHGMTSVGDDRLIHPYDYVKKEWVNYISYDLPTLIEPAKGYEDSVYNALREVPHLRVWRKKDVPAYLHYGSNPNVTSIVVLPDLGWTVTGWKHQRLRGTHGYDPTYSDMHVMFRAVGPDFKRGYTEHRLFTNTDVYPLLCHLLGIAPAKNDGSLDGVSQMLAR